MAKRMAILAHGTALLGSHKGHQRHVQERQPEPTQQAANVVAAPLPKQVTTTKERSLPQPEIFYPTLVFNKANILEMMPLTMKQPWLSPQSISGWPLLLDVIDHHLGNGRKESGQNERRSLSSDNGEF